jgi:hypothetical protein
MDVSGLQLKQEQRAVQANLAQFLLEIEKGMSSMCFREVKAYNETSRPSD